MDFVRRVEVTLGVARHVDGRCCLRGTVRLRSVASQVHDLAAGVEGVVAVDAQGVRYQEDDLLAIMPMV